MGKPRVVMQQTTSSTFPPLIQQFGDDFTVLSTFVPTDTLEHLKNCGKNTGKSADVVAEDNVIFLRAVCWAFYRKSVKYKVKMVVKRNE